MFREKSKSDGIWVASKSGTFRKCCHAGQTISIGDETTKKIVVDVVSLRLDSDDISNVEGELGKDSSDFERADVVPETTEKRQRKWKDVLGLVSESGSFQAESERQSQRKNDWPARLGSPFGLFQKQMASSESTIEFVLSSYEKKCFKFFWVLTFNHCSYKSECLVNFLIYWLIFNGITRMEKVGSY